MKKKLFIVFVSSILFSCASLEQYSMPPAGTPSAEITIVPNEARYFAMFANAENCSEEVGFTKNNHPILSNNKTLSVPANNEVALKWGYLSSEYKKVISCQVIVSFTPLKNVKYSYLFKRNDTHCSGTLLKLDNQGKYVPEINVKQREPNPPFLNGKSASWCKRL